MPRSPPPPAPCRPRMSFDDFVCSLAGLGRLRERGGLPGVSDSDVVKIIAAELPPAREP